MAFRLSFYSYVLPKKHQWRFYMLHKIERYKATNTNTQQNASKSIKQSTIRLTRYFKNILEKLLSK